MDQNSEQHGVDVKLHNAKEMRNKQWLVDQLIPLGEMTIVVGDPGIGKSQVTASLIGSVTTGSPWPNSDQYCQKGSVVHINVEDTPEEVSTPRFVAAGAHPDKVIELRGIADGDDFRPFRISEDIEHLRQLLCRHPEVRLVVIDPLGAHLGTKISNQDSRFRQIIDPLAKLAKSFDIAIVLVAHLTKAKSQPYLHRIPGSVGLGGAVRAAYAVDRDPSGMWDGLLICVKNSYAPQLCFAFRVTPVELNGSNGMIRTSRVIFEPEPVPMPEDNTSSKSTTRGMQIGLAKEFLKHVLKDGPVDCETVRKLAEQFGIASRTLDRARKELGVVWRNRPSDGVREYILPDQEGASSDFDSDRQPAEEATNYSALPASSDGDSFRQN